MPRIHPAWHENTALDAIYPRHSQVFVVKAARRILNKRIQLFTRTGFQLKANLPHFADSMIFILKNTWGVFIRTSFRRGDPTWTIIWKRPGLHRECQGPVQAGVWGRGSVNKHTHPTKSITFPQRRWRTVIISTIYREDWGTSLIQQRYNGTLAIYFNINTCRCCVHSIALYYLHFDRCHKYLASYNYSTERMWSTIIARRLLIRRATTKREKQFYVCCFVIGKNTVRCSCLFHQNSLFISFLLKYLWR